MCVVFPLSEAFPLSVVFPVLKIVSDFKLKEYVVYLSQFLSLRNLFFFFLFIHHVSIKNTSLSRGTAVCYNTIGCALIKKTCMAVTLTELGLSLKGGRF